MKFSSHGGLKIWVENNIVFMEVSGAWNLEKAKEFAQALNNEIAPKITPPFGAIGILHDDWMPTADAVPFLNQATKIAIAAGLVREAYVSTSPISAKITEQLVLPEECQRYQKQEFSDINDAIAWVKGEGQSRIAQ